MFRVCVYVCMNMYVCVYALTPYQTLTDDYFIHVCIVITHGMCTHLLVFARNLSSKFANN